MKENYLPPPRRASAEELPILDFGAWLAGGSVGDLVRQFDNACTNTGFFYVINHGIPEDALEAVFEADRKYFAISEEERLRDRVDERYRRGFNPMGCSTHPGHKPDLKESFDFAVDLPLDHPDVLAGIPLHGPNKWPSDKPWLRAAAEPYFEHTKVLALNLLRLLALAVGEKEDFFVQRFQKPMLQTRLFHYPPQASPTELELGTAEHTDYGMLTILAQDPIGGLELKTRSGEWVTAPYVPGTLVVNLGDLIKVWTNDHYVSNFHRVANRTGRERYSIPTFVNLDFDAQAYCLDKFAKEGIPPKHAPIKSGDYLVSRFATVQGYKTPVELSTA